jgi:hypothetical protein
MAGTSRLSELAPLSPPALCRTGPPLMCPVARRAGLYALNSEQISQSQFSERRYAIPPELVSCDFSIGSIRAIFSGKNLLPRNHHCPFFRWCKSWSLWRRSIARLNFGLAAMAGTTPRSWPTWAARGHRVELRGSEPMSEIAAFQPIAIPKLLHKNTILYRLNALCGASFTTSSCRFGTGGFAAPTSLSGWPLAMTPRAFQRLARYQKRQMLGRAPKPNDLA